MKSFSYQLRTIFLNSYSVSIYLLYSLLPDLDNTKKIIHKSLYTSLFQLCYKTRKLIFI